jgi:hypothetical protein
MIITVEVVACRIGTGPSALAGRLEFVVYGCIDRGNGSARVLGGSVKIPRVVAMQRRVVDDGIDVRRRGRGDDAGNYGDDDRDEPETSDERRNVGAGVLMRLLIAWLLVIIRCW